MRAVARRAINGFFWVVLVLMGMAGHAFGQFDFNYTTLDAPGGTGGTEALGISGTTIVGAYVDAGRNNHGFILTGTLYTGIDYDGTASNTTCNGISDGYIVGNSGSGAFVYNMSSGTFTRVVDASAPNPVSLQGISGNQVVGIYLGNDFLVHGVYGNYSDPNSFVQLDDPNDGGSDYLTGISGNNIVGFYVGTDSAIHSFIYNQSSQVFTEINDPATVGTGKSTQAYGVSGTDVVGTYVDAYGDNLGFLYSGTNYTELGITTDTQACAISGSTIVGFYNDENGESHGFEATPITTATLNVIANPTSGGTVSGSGTFALNSSQQISATANSGWTFVQWNDGVTTNPRMVTVPLGGATYAAEFSQELAPLYVAANPTNGGVVSNSGTFPVNSSQQISATAYKGWTFTGWNDGVATNPRTVTVPEGGITYTAEFSQAVGILNVVANPSDAGAAIGSGTFAVKSSVEISATANNGWTFNGWSDGVKTNPRTVSVAAGAMTYTAEFSQQMAVLKVAADPGNGGTVSGSGTFGVNSSEQISATADSGWTFKEWNDNVTTNPRTVTVPAGGVTYTAKFIEGTPLAGKYTLLIGPAAGPSLPQGQGYATVTVTPKGGVTMAGKLADGESIHAAASLVSGSGGSQFSVDIPLSYPSVTPKNTKGSLVGTVAFVTESGTSELSGTLGWSKPQQTKGDYPAAIVDANLSVIGSAYTDYKTGVLPGFPAAGGGVYGTLELSDTSGVILSGSCQLTAKNKLVFGSPPDGVTMTITPATGVFKGSFEYPAPGKKPVKTDFQGVLLQGQVEGGGYFLGPDGGGRVSLGE